MTDVEPVAGRDGRGAWQFGRFAEVTQALRDARLVPQGQGGMDSQAHRVVRSAAREALSPERMAAWREGFAGEARRLMEGLKEGEVDLVAAVARPWSLEVALRVTGVGRERAGECAGFAETLYLAAARATDGAPGAEAMGAVVALAQILAAAPGRASGIADVQTFVALSQTLPALLAGAWRALLREPGAVAQLRVPGAAEKGVDELLRLGSPARAVFREAAEETRVGETAVGRGERVTLLLGAANRDPARFADPERLDLRRDAAGQLGLGAGVHSCAGGMLVRLAVMVATEALVERGGTMELIEVPDAAMVWHGGFAMRSPATVTVIWRCR